MINVEGRRWVDEGAEHQLLYLRQVRRDDPAAAAQPGLPDLRHQGLHLLEPRYSTSVPFKADTLEGLVKQLTSITRRR